MKIGLLLPSLLMTKRYQERIFAPKGLFLDLADQLGDHGHQVYVYSSSDIKTKAQLISGEKLFEKKDMPSVKLREGKNGYLLFKLNYHEYELDLTQRAFLHAQAHGLDIIHSYHDTLAHYFASMTDIPVVYTLHDPVFAGDSLEGWRINRFAQDHYIAISKRQAELYADEVNIITTIYHGIDVDSFPFLDQKGKYLAFGGRLIPEKGAIDAMKLSKMLKLPLKMATSDNYLDTPHFEKEVKPLLHDQLNFLTGYLHKKERDEWLKNALALLFPIHWEEPFGMLMIEAMACGTPVIAYNRGSVPEVVKDGVTGFIIDHSSKIKDHRDGEWIIKKTGVEGLVEAVQRLDEIDRNKCREHVKKNFSVDKMVRKHEKVYKKVISQQ